MSTFPGISHLELGEKYRIYINMVLGCTNMPTFQNVLSLEKLSLTIFSSSAPVLSCFLIFFSVFPSYAVVTTFSSLNSLLLFPKTVISRYLMVAWRY